MIGTIFVNFKNVILFCIFVVEIIELKNFSFQNWKKHNIVVAPGIVMSWKSERKRETVFFVDIGFKMEDNFLS